MTRPIRWRWLPSGDSWRWSVAHAFGRIPGQDWSRLVDWAQGDSGLRIGRDTRVDDSEVLVGDSWFKRDDLPTVLVNFMRSSAEHAEETKRLTLELDAARDDMAEMRRAGILYERQTLALADELRVARNEYRQLQQDFAGETETPLDLGAEL